MIEVVSDPQFQPVEIGIDHEPVTIEKRYFALKLPLAVDPETVSFAYVDPGHQTDRELHSWGAAHGPLWDALRKKGRQVRVIGIAVENATVDRTARVLEAWAAADPGTPDEGLTVKHEIKAIDALAVECAGPQPG